MQLNQLKYLYTFKWKYTKKLIQLIYIYTVRNSLYVNAYIYMYMFYRHISENNRYDSVCYIVFISEFKGWNIVLHVYKVSRLYVKYSVSYEALKFTYICMSVVCVACIYLMMFII